MNNVKLDISISPSTTMILLIIVAALAYFVYDHNIDAAFATVAVTIVIAIVFILSFIPVIGWISAIPLCHYWVIPKILDIVELEYTWLITVIFVIIILYGFIITVIMLIIAGKIISAIMK